MSSDGELLRRYVDEGSESAFTELVQRHINLVYRTALRRVGCNAHAADDVTQKVFTRLAQKARLLTGRSNLAGWLYTSTRYVAADTVRAEQRRRAHEEEAQTMNEINLEVRLAADQLEPLLDELMDLLPDRDREAVLLHFFEGHSFIEVGTALSLNPDAVRMRVNRALERLRSTLTRRGVTSSVTVLAGALSLQSTLAAPASLGLVVAENATHAAGALGSFSVTARLLKVARSPQLVLATVALVVVIAGLTIASTSTEKPALAPSSSAPPAVAGQIASESPSVTAGTAVHETENSPVSPAPATPVPLALRQSGILSPVEIKILAHLWLLHLTTHPPPGVRAGMKPNAAGANFEKIADGCERLVEGGWVALGPKNGNYFLTPSGVEFCTAHRAELEVNPGFQRATNVMPAN